VKFCGEIKQVMISGGRADGQLAKQDAVVASAIIDGNFISGAELVQLS
jgi:hypothetical protein